MILGRGGLAGPISNLARLWRAQPSRIIQGAKSPCSRFDVWKVAGRPRSRFNRRDSAALPVGELRILVSVPEAIFRPAFFSLKVGSASSTE